MRATQSYINTSKTTASDAELISHQLMLRCGLIRRLASGIYSWMPLGLKVLRKVEQIVRQEMNSSGALEVLLPTVQPSELWQQSNRWELYGKELLRVKDRHDREFCFGPTHEEVVVDMVKKDVTSYKQLPLCLYQIQTKFRDEIRPRFGVMRAREFIMKDAYSFHPDQDSLEGTYDIMKEAYKRILARLGLDFRVVDADTGAIGGSASHEFQVLASCGEDIIAYCEESSYAANLELAYAVRDKANILTHEILPMVKVATPQQKTCAEVSTFLAVDIKKCIKSIVVDGIDNKPVLLLLRADHNINEVKLSKLSQIKQPLSFSSASIIEQYFNCPPGFIGPVGFTGLVIADEDVVLMSNFVCGANSEGCHFNNVNFNKDCPMPGVIADLRNVVEGDTAPDGGKIKLCRGIEVGHIFQLRTKYSQAMGLNYLDSNGRRNDIEMGCYGIGISRIIAAAIEQHHDERGMLLPINLSIYEVVIVPINYSKSSKVANIADNLYQDLLNNNIDVLLDDRNERLGSILADSELLGINYRLVVSDKNLNNNQVELYTRQTNQTILIPLEQALCLVTDLVKDAKSI